MRLSYIDNLRAFAIVIVVMRHVAEWSLGIKTGSFYTFYHSFDMPLFAFVSGLFALKKLDDFSVKNATLFLYSKSKRLLLPFFVIGFLTFLLKNESFDLKLCYLQHCKIYWFLPALFYCFVGGAIFKGLCAIVKSRNVVVSLFLFAACFLMLVGLDHFLQLKIPYLHQSIKLFPFFLMGEFFRKYDRVVSLLERNNVVSICFIVYIVLIFVPLPIPTLFSYTAPFAIVVLNYFFKKVSFPEFFQKVGQNTMEVYMLHYLFLPSLFPVGFWLQEQTNVFFQNTNLIILLFLVSVITVPIIMLCMICSYLIRSCSMIDCVLFGNRKK